MEKILFTENSENSTENKITVNEIFRVLTAIKNLDDRSMFILSSAIGAELEKDVKKLFVIRGGK